MPYSSDLARFLFDAVRFIEFVRLKHSKSTIIHRQGVLMCSTPKSSSFPRRHTKKRSTPEDYQAYAAMLRNASACYERNQQFKEERRRLAASQKTELTILPEQSSQSASANTQPRKAHRRILEALLKPLRQVFVFANYHA